MTSAAARPLTTARWVVPAMLGLVILFVALWAAVRGADPVEQDIEQRLLPPSIDYPMGTDGFGRDVHTRVVWGVGYSLAIAALTILFAGGVGALLGSLAAVVRGRTEYLIIRVADLLLSIPSFLLALIIVIVLGTHPAAIASALALGFAPRLARSTWAAMLTVRDEEFVLAARAAGVGPATILLRHLLPALKGTLLAQLASIGSAAIAMEAALSFLGLGVPPPTPSLGRMLLEGSRQYFETAPWVTLFPGAMLAVAGLALVLVARALEGRNLVN